MDKMLYIAIGAAAVASTVVMLWFTKRFRARPVVELTEWQATPAKDLSLTLDRAFTRF